jgi:hypothetical protein
MTQGDMAAKAERRTVMATKADTVNPAAADPSAAATLIVQRLGRTRTTDAKLEQLL